LISDSLSTIPEILWIDKDSAVITIMGVIFKDKYQIDQARTTDKAIEMSLKRNYSLIITDLPVGGNTKDIRFISEIKQHEKYRHIPVIAASASLSDYSQEYLYNNGFLYFLSKPFSIKELSAILAEVLHADTLLT
jgi:CheY-like chemotaxis protein